MWFLIIPFVFFILLCVRIVTPQTVRTVEFLGKFTRILRPGLNFILPILEITRNQDLFRKNISVEVDGITSDNVTVYVGLNVVSYVQDDKNDTENGSIYKSVYLINDSRTLISSTIDEQLRAMVSTFNHKEIFSKIVQCFLLPRPKGSGL